MPAVGHALAAAGQTQIIGGGLAVAAVVEVVADGLLMDTSPARHGGIMS